MKQKELDIILENHGKWLRGKGGKKADINNVDLGNANLRRADLKGADLSNADLRCADLRGANLSYANLSNALLNWIIWQDIEGLTVICVQVDTTRRNNQITYIKELEIWTTGCFQGTLEELKTSIENTHKDNEKLKAKYYRVIDFILQEAE
ncbi:TPA: pentapeptide repeat-containing protein [Listeria monocytogenes]|nr:pentapeptide repeat-containing protein [Listeria monocytogenes]HDU0945381.1 pentapeptide repeat-containing protein [Listeria monocytogenes]